MTWRTRLQILRTRLLKVLSHTIHWNVSWNLWKELFRSRLSGLLKNCVNSMSAGLGKA